MIMSEHSMKAIVVDLRDKFKTGGLAFLYHQGLVQGEVLVRKYLELGVENLKDLLKCTSYTC